MCEIGPIPGRDGQKIAYGELALELPLPSFDPKTERKEPRTVLGCVWFVLGCWAVIFGVVGVAALWGAGLWWLSSKSGLGENEGATLWLFLTGFVVLSIVFTGMYFDNRGS